jgi:hypothetical protein
MYNGGKGGLPLFSPTYIDRFIIKNDILKE